MRVLRALASGAHTVVAVLAEQRPTEQESVSALAKRLGLPVWPPDLVRNPELADTLHRERIDVLVNVHSLQLVAAEVLAAPLIGSFNLHPGPLPRYAGLDTPSWAVYNRERRYGSTVHWMTSEVDGGPIAFSAEFGVDPLETAISLYLKCVRHGVPLVSKLVEVAASEGRAGIPAHPQDRDGRRYFRRIPPHERWLLWSLQAEHLAALVRACDYGPFDSPWGKARTLVGRHEVEVLSATTRSEAAHEEPGTIGKSVDGGVLVAAADRWLLIEAVQVDGRRLDPAMVLPHGERCSPVAL